MTQKKSKLPQADRNPPLEEEPVISKRNSRNVYTLLFNRPKQLNSFSTSMLEFTFYYLHELENSEHVNMIFLKGKGRAFSSGADVVEMAGRIKDPSKRTEMIYYSDMFHDILQFMPKMKTPTISFMDGVAVGSGSAVGNLANFSIATEHTKSCMPETRFGSFCDTGTSYTLPRLNGNLGKYIALTAKMLEAEDVVIAGLASHFVPSNRLDALEESLIKLDNPNLESIKRTIDQFSINIEDMPPSKILQRKNRDTIERCFQFEKAVDIIEALKKDGSKFALETIDQINGGSPIGIALTLENMRRASELTYAQAIIMERHLWRFVFIQPDFCEGIALLMVKGAKPRWIRKEHKDVDFKKDIIETYFGDKYGKMDLDREWVYNTLPIVKSKMKSRL
ncbi:ClpP/crotonase-like domain-containing protein [Pilaira anomala]|nr:ClpP/crotonase-like domain-containing protein [Pilaira anomala]